MGRCNGVLLLVFTADLRGAVFPDDQSAATELSLGLQPYPQKVVRPPKPTPTSFSGGGPGALGYIGPVFFTRSLPSDSRTPTRRRTLDDGATYYPKSRWFYGKLNFRTGRSSPTQLFYDCSKAFNTFLRKAELAARDVEISHCRGSVRFVEPVRLRSEVRDIGEPKRGNYTNRASVKEVGMCQDRILGGSPSSCFRRGFGGSR